MRRQLCDLFPDVKLLHVPEPWTDLWAVFWSRGRRGSSPSVMAR